MEQSNRELGFVNILTIIALAAVFVSVPVIYVNNFVKENTGLKERVVILENELGLNMNLGASVSSTGSGETIGQFRINVNNSFSNLNDQLINSTSVDPGHQHTASAVSGTISIAKGGTGTSTSPTVTNQLLISTGTSVFGLTNELPNCDAATSSKLLFTSTSQQWSCGTDSVFNTTGTTGSVLRSSSTELIWDGLPFAMRATTTEITSDGVYGLATTTIAGNLLANGGGLRIKVAIQSNNGGDAYSFAAYYGGTLFASSAVVANTFNEFEITLLNYQSAKQFAVWRQLVSNNTILIVTSDTRGYLPTVDSTVNQTLRLEIAGIINNLARVFYYTIEQL